MGKALIGNFKGSKGDIGATGPQGIQGIKGATGSTGATGAKGDTGANGPPGQQGIKGDTGGTGAQGQKGDAGPQGVQGVQGIKGDTGGKGAVGATGLTGPKGDIGPKGPAGIKGDTGSVNPDTPIIFDTPTTFVEPKSGDAIKLLFGRFKSWLNKWEGKIVQSTSITQPGFIMDGKTCSEAITKVNSDLKFDVSNASANGWCVNALHVDVNNPLGDANKSNIIDGSTTINVPVDIAWGVREVLYISYNGIIVRITGIKTDGNTNVIWTNIYNTGNWRGWIEH